MLAYLIHLKKFWLESSNYTTSLHLTKAEQAVDINIIALNRHNHILCSIWTFLKQNFLVLFLIICHTPKCGQTYLIHVEDRIIKYGFCLNHFALLNIKGLLLIIALL